MSDRDRKRSLVRGGVLIALAIAMVLVTINTIVRGPFGDAGAWVVTVVFVQVLTVLLLAALGWSDLRGPRDRRGRRD
ncbi:hypothetical protein [Curtobacterium sp. VKM Ac-2887]|uniref:hypothetical protein n=1 Tax=Curtobacterium sp. VKM Ac-2887 TaxID=2783819 RepID=UPI00188D29E2|nr:hypothetical protein [Curtobacterium sp. VKM Ac-2887]MBF4587934.1 hypothetical protein [Curtobacterium sp. VKM Ac-2887]